MVINSSYAKYYICFYLTAMRVHISEDTKLALQDAPVRYVITPRGVVNVKVGLFHGIHRCGFKIINRVVDGIKSQTGGGAIF